MLGSLLKEMSVLIILTDWLDNCGWTVALSNAKVILAGNISIASWCEVAKKIILIRLQNKLLLPVRDLHQLMH